MKVRNARAVSVDCGAARNLCISTGYVFAKHCANASSLSIAAGDGSTNCTAASVGRTAIIPRPIAMKEEVAPTSGQRTNVPARIVLRSSNQATSASTSGLLYGRVSSAKTKFFTAPTNVEESEGKVDPCSDIHNPFSVPPTSAICSSLLQSRNQLFKPLSHHIFFRAKSLGICRFESVPCDDVCGFRCLESTSGYQSLPALDCRQDCGFSRPHSPCRDPLIASASTMDRHRQRTFMAAALNDRMTVPPATRIAGRFP